MSLQRVTRRGITLPPEIMTPIFECCIPCDFYSNPPVPNRHTVPLLLASVSRYWRNIALAMPKFWCSLRLFLDGSDARLALLKTWLSRSGRCPITLALFYDYRPSAVPPEQHAYILRPHSHQLKSIRLHLPYADIVKLAQWNLPLLQHLEFTWTNRTVPTDEVLTIGLFKRAPLLHEFTTSGVVLLTGLLRDSIFPWAKLKTFTCSDYTINQVWDVLRIAPLLEHCTFRAECLANLASPLGLATSHTKLHSLSLSDGAHDLLILSRMQLPELRELHFTVEQRHAHSMRTINPLLPCLIRKLDLVFRGTAGTPLIEYLQSLLSLTDLHLKEVSGLILKSLFALLSSDATFLLGLENLYVECEDNVGLYPSLVKMLLVRGKGSRRLHSAVFHFRASIDSLNAHQRSVIDALKRDGMQLSITGGVISRFSGDSFRVFSSKTVA
ncbi:hypothetical protein C8R43DRAFT_1036009 [Mycena crocata]|nr:hypothetical protein C8R43DRAFT_1036009 [Mycena crocata]